MTQQEVRILLVDDEPDILEFLGYNLRSEGFTVEVATNGSEAVRMARKFFPHLILLDVMMPGMDGIETCQKIRNIPELQEVMIAFLTARGEDYSQLAGFDAGADDYIVKPFHFNEVLARIRALTRRPDKVLPTELKVGKLTLDAATRKTTNNGKEMLYCRMSLQISKPFFLGSIRSQMTRS